MKKVIILIAAITMIGSLFAKSAFSALGYPESFAGSDVYSTGMGGAGLSDLYRVNNGYKNPSLAVTANYVIFSTSVSMGYFTYKDDQNRSFTDDGFRLPHLNVTLPIKNHRVAFNFNTFLNGNLKNQSRRNIFIESDSLFITEKNTAQNHIYNVDLIYAFKNPIVNIGVAAQYYFGSNLNLFEQEFEGDEYSDYKNTRNERSKFFKGPGFTLGLSRKINNFSLGFVYSSKVKLEGTDDFVTTFNKINMGDSEFELPVRTAFSATWKIKERFKIAGDFDYEMWEDVDSYKDPVNSYKLAFGAAYDPKWGYGKWFEKIPLRVGGYVRQLPFKANNKKIMEQAVSFGWSIPLRTPNKQLHIALEYITRGNKSDHSVEDNTFLINIGTVGFDIFSKRKNKTGHRDIPKADKMEY